MKRITFSAILIIAAAVALLGGGAISAQDKYTLQVPGGLAFAEFRGYEGWPVIAISENGGQIAVIVGNSVVRQRQVFPRRRQDGENPLDPEKTRDVPRSANGARNSA